MLGTNENAGRRVGIVRVCDVEVADDPGAGAVVVIIDKLATAHCASVDEGAINGAAETGTVRGTKESGATYFVVRTYAGTEIVAVEIADRDQAGAAAEIPGEVELAAGDVLNRANVRQGHNDRADHMAGVMGEPDRPEVAGEDPEVFDDAPRYPRAEVDRLSQIFVLGVVSPRVGVALLAAPPSPFGEGAGRAERGAAHIGRQHRLLHGIGGDEVERRVVPLLMGQPFAAVRLRVECGVVFGARVVFVRVAAGREGVVVDEDGSALTRQESAPSPNESCR